MDSYTVPAHCAIQHCMWFWLLNCLLLLQATLFTYETCETNVHLKKKWKVVGRTASTQRNMNLEQHTKKQFAKLMMQGKVKAAL